MIAAALACAHLDVTLTARGSNSREVFVIVFHYFK